MYLFLQNVVMTTATSGEMQVLEGRLARYVLISSCCFSTVLVEHLLQVLLERGARVYMAARSKSKASEAIEWIQAEANGKAPVFLELDLANLDSVRRAAEEFRQ